jgi:PadR family transcriptional regulator PadR
MSSKSNFINGLPEMLSLRLLARQEMYGYQLVAAIREQTGEAFTFGEGCIYPILHKLDANGLLSSRKEVVDGRPRHYYKTTAKGKKHLDSLAGEWSKVVRGAETIMGALYV